MVAKPTSRALSKALSRQTPAGEAATRVLWKWLNDVNRLLRRAVKRQDAERSVKSVHALRVATRRASAALGVFADLLDADQVRRARRRLRRIRRVAGAVRDCDVHAELIKRSILPEDGDNVRSGVKALRKALQAQRDERMPELHALADRWPSAKLRKRWERLLGTVRDDASAGEALAELAGRVLAREIDAVNRAGQADLTDIENVHELRVCLKHLRYAAEVVEQSMNAQWKQSVLPRLVELQVSLGEINDAHLLLEVLAAHARGPSGGRTRSTSKPRSPRKGARKAPDDGLAVVQDRQRARLESGHRAFLEVWSADAFAAIAADLLDALRPPSPVRASTVPEPLSSPRVLRPAGFIEPKGSPESAVETRRRSRRRIAAIDVGTNSIRLIVAENQPDGSYRVLDDEKELTRLGRGLLETGKLSPEAIEHTAVTVARMRSIAEGYQADEIRVVATAAARQASNSDALARLIQERAGLGMQVISGEEEALLAYRSAASAFDLRDMSSAVVDIGGGSSEIVLAAAVKDRSDDARRAGLGGGVIERVYTVPIGAVVLTEKFGGPEVCGGKRFQTMRDEVARTLKHRIGRPPIVPQIVIGTGGTLTTLAAMVKLRKLGAGGDGLFGSVQGFEITRAEIKHVLAQLRSMPVKDRVKVPGLSADRADIIVAGLVIVDAVMKRLDANRLLVHEGGIRDGILLGMVRGAEAAGEPRRDPMKGVRRFAKACGYEADHSRHVTTLALEIFDQLARQQEKIEVEKGMAFDGEARLLLEAAALLHDIGYLINYARHHKHSYHLIVHADLPGLTTRQVHVIANVARYHRAAEPKAKHRTLATLSPEDQARVRGLSAILRVADGLDRTHTQSVDGVDVKIEKNTAQIGVRAEAEPSVDMWGAVRKAGLFESAFGRSVHLEWRESSAKVSEERSEAVRERARA